jgi:hypothetical protein
MIILMAALLMANVFATTTFNVLVVYSSNSCTPGSEIYFQLVNMVNAPFSMTRPCTPLACAAEGAGQSSQTLCLVDALPSFPAITAITTTYAGSLPACAVEVTLVAQVVGWKPNICIFHV